MTEPHPARAFVAENVVLDGRLALFHQRQRWLAVADLHFGYELSQRAAGRLVPLWGMASIEERLRGLVEEYRPEHLILLGDLVHDKTAGPNLAELVRRLSALTKPILLAGNHDRQIAAIVPLERSWNSDGFHFHHGDCETSTPGAIQIIGHHHPTGNITDGAGLRLKLPAFVQQGSCWVLPAFSPWAAGGLWPEDERSRIWLCSLHRILLRTGGGPAPFARAESRRWSRPALGPHG